MCLCRRQASSTSLLFTLLSLLSYPSLPLRSSEYLRTLLLHPTCPPTVASLATLSTSLLPPFIPLSSLENTRASLPVSDTFRQESQPSSPSLDISREHAHACARALEQNPSHTFYAGMRGWELNLTYSHRAIKSFYPLYPYEESAH